MSVAHVYRQRSGAELQIRPSPFVMSYAAPTQLLYLCVTTPSGTRAPSVDNWTIAVHTLSGEAAFRHTVQR